MAVLSVIIWILLYLFALVVFTDCLLRFFSGGIQDSVFTLVVVPALFAVFLIGPIRERVIELGGALYTYVVNVCSHLTHLERRSSSEVKYVPFSQFVLAFLVFALALCLRVSYSEISEHYLNVGSLDFKKFETANRDLNTSAPIYLRAAEASFHRSVAFDPDNSEAYYRLGFISDYLGDHSEARTMYWIAARGGYRNVYNNLARLDILDGRFVQAADSLRRVCYLLNDNESAKDQHKENCDDFDNAIASLEVPGNDEERAIYFAFFKNLGWLFVEQEAYERAIIFLNLASIIDPYMGFPYCLRARIFEAQKNDAQANDQWRRCANEDSEFLGLPEEYSALWIRALESQ